MYAWTDGDNVSSRSESRVSKVSCWTLYIWELSVGPSHEHTNYSSRTPQIVNACHFTFSLEAFDFGFAY